jgi:hypothetical protein
MFTKKSTLKEILNTKSAEEILTTNNVPCVTCPFAQMEMEKLTIGQICGTYELNLNKILEELNKL